MRNMTLKFKRDLSVSNRRKREKIALYKTTNNVFKVKV